MLKQSLRFLLVAGLLFSFSSVAFADHHEEDSMEMSDDMTADTESASDMEDSNQPEKKPMKAEKNTAKNQKAKAHGHKKHDKKNH